MKMLPWQASTISHKTPTNLDVVRGSPFSFEIELN